MEKNNNTIGLGAISADDIKERNNAMGMATNYCVHCGADLGDPSGFAHADLRDCLKVKDVEIERLRTNIATCVRDNNESEDALMKEIELRTDYLRDAVLYIDRYRDGNDPCDASVASWRASVVSDVKLKEQSDV